MLPPDLLISTQFIYLDFIYKIIFLDWHNDAVV